MANKAPAIGIDLGTTYSCVAVWNGGKVETITNALGNRTTPSYVAFNEVESLVGEPAKDQAARNPRNTIFDAKRLIGREFNDANIQKDMKHWPFRIVEDRKGNPRFQVEYKEQVKRFAPEEISGMILTKMKETAEDYLGSKVTDAVITVPAYFNDAQRQATIDAAKIAELKVLRLINEPTAAALAYGLDKNLNGKKTVLVFDLGGGTFDVSILTIRDGSSGTAEQKFEVLSTSGDTHLGGEDFDSRLLAHVMQQFKLKHKSDLVSNAKAVRRLRTACERAKRQLSASVETVIEVDAIQDGIDFSAKVSRARFEELCADLFNSTIEPVKKALADAGLQKSSIDEVLLVGGSTRIPKIQKILQVFFNGKQLNKSINQDEAVAHGAAILAANLPGYSPVAVPSFSLEEVTPLSVGIEADDGIMSVMIERNTKIPVRRYREYWNRDDYQTSAAVKVYEGERALTKHNHLLGEFELEIPPHLEGHLAIDVTFEIDSNGILQVSALETCTGNQQKITFLKNKGRLSKKRIGKMIAKAKRYKAKDEVLLANAAARRRLECYLNNINRLSDRNASIFTDAVRWLNRNMQADKETYKNKLKEIREELGCGSGESDSKRQRVEECCTCCTDPK